MRPCARLFHHIFFCIPFVFIVLIGSPIPAEAQEQTCESGDLQCITFVTPDAQRWFGDQGGNAGERLTKTLNSIISIAFSVSSVLLVLYIAWFGTALIYQQMKGDIFQAQTAKRNMSGAIYGISVLLCSYIILNFFVPNLLKARNDGLLNSNALTFKADFTDIRLAFLNHPIYPCNSDLARDTISEFKAFAEIPKGYGTDSRNPAYPFANTMEFSFKRKNVGIGLLGLDNYGCNITATDYTITTKVLYATENGIQSIDIDQGAESGKHSGQEKPTLSSNVFAVVVLTITKEDGGKETFRSNVLEGDILLRHPEAQSDERQYIITEHAPGLCDLSIFTPRGLRKAIGLETDVKTAKELIDTLNNLDWDECKLEFTN